MASRRCSKPLIGLSRHVLQFSYVGTEYSGVAPNQTSKLPSIHSKIYNALEHLSLAFPPVVALSSRTDAGVHAVCNTAHVDLWRRPRDKAKWLAGEVKSSGTVKGYRQVTSTSHLAVFYFTSGSIFFKCEDGVCVCACVCVALPIPSIYLTITVGVCVWVVRLECYGSCCLLL